ncbi:MAG: GtrA family protein [Bacteroidales bacterium]
MIEKFIIFAFVGFTGLLIDFFVTWLLKEKFLVNKYISNGLGFLTAASSNYLLNRFWTFASNNPEIGREYLTFIGISVAGLAINSLILYLLLEKLKISKINPESGIRFYLSKLIATAVVTIWNFFMNFFITFS